MEPLLSDLHVHTPFDRAKRFGEDVRAAIQAFQSEKPQRLAEIADEFVAACRDAAMDLVALTDHHSVDGYRYLRAQFGALADQARDQDLAMPAILPGVEFSVGGERPIHFLVIFAASTDPEVIDGAIASRRDMTAGGAKFRTFALLAESAAHAIDSLTAIKTVVFEQGAATMAELRAALDADFEGHEPLPLPSDTEGALREIIAEAEARHAI